MIPIDAGMALNFNAWNSAAGNVLTMTALTRLPNGTLNIQQRVMTPSTDRGISQIVMNMHLAELLSVTISSALSTLQRGECFTQVKLVKTQASGDIPLRLLIQNYVTGAEESSYPGGERISSTDGKGVLKFLDAPDSTSDLEAVFQVPAGAEWELIAIYGQLATSAVQGDRTLFFEALNDIAGDVYLVSAGNIAAEDSATVIFCFGNFGEDLQGLHFIESIPLLVAPAEHAIGVNGTGFQAGDTYDQIQIAYRELIAI